MELREGENQRQWRILSVACVMMLDQMAASQGKHSILQKSDEGDIHALCKAVALLLCPFSLP